MVERGAGWSHDISDTFDGDQKLYIDHAHVVPEGNVMIVQRLRAILQSSDR